MLDFVFLGRIKGGEWRKEGSGVGFAVKPENIETVITYASTANLAT